MRQELAIFADENVDLISLYHLPYENLTLLDCSNGLCECDVSGNHDGFKAGRNRTRLESRMTKWPGIWPTNSGNIRKR